MTGCRIKEIEHCTNESLLLGTSTKCVRGTFTKEDVKERLLCSLCHC